MNYENNQTNAMTAREKFLLPAMVESDFSQEELAGDLEGMQMSFTRVKIPSGTVQFELPTDNPDDPDYEKELTGVILYHHLNNAYWPDGKAYDDNTSPLCSSTDGKLGIGEPGGVCATCALNEYGSAPEGNAKACKNMRTLYLLRSGDLLPLQVTLPPTSLKPFREFTSRAFVMRRRASFGSVVKIGLKKMVNGSNEYSVATFSRLYDFEGEELVQIRAYANNFKEQMQLLLSQRNEAQGDKYKDICEYSSSQVEPANGGTAFCLGQQINGDREALPA